MRRKAGGDYIPTLFLDCVQREVSAGLEDLERSTRDDLEHHLFPYPHLKATITSSESLLDVVGASKDEVVEDAREMLRRVSSTREPRAYPGFRGVAATVAHVRPSSRGPGAIRIPGSGGEEPVKLTVSTV